MSIDIRQTHRMQKTTKSPRMIQMGAMPPAPVARVPWPNVRQPPGGGGGGGSGVGVGVGTGVGVGGGVGVGTGTGV